MFEEYEPTGGLDITPIPEGWLSIGKSGSCTCHRSDLAKVGITDCVQILTDSTTLRIGLRRPRPGRPSLRVHDASSGGKSNKTRARIQLAGALRSIDLETEAVAGRFRVQVKDSELLIINLTDTDEEGDEEGSGREGKEARTAK